MNIIFWQDTSIIIHFVMLKCNIKFSPDPLQLQRIPKSLSLFLIGTILQPHFSTSRIALVVSWEYALEKFATSNS